MKRIAVAYALAAEMMGMKFIYLEAGSGARRHVEPEIISRIKKHTDLYIIAGGGIKSPEDACELIDAGADAIVIGTIVEQDPDTAKKIVEKVKKGCGGSSRDL
jgi:phosphoglycerol geranylgeranyltransferase